MDPFISRPLLLHRSGLFLPLTLPCQRPLLNTLHQIIIISHLQTIQPSILNLILIPLEHKEPIIVNVPYLLLLVHIEGLDHMPEVLDLLLQSLLIPFHVLTHPAQRRGGIMLELLVELLLLVPCSIHLFSYLPSLLSCVIDFLILLVL